MKQPEWPSRGGISVNWTIALISLSVWLLLAYLVLALVMGERFLGVVWSLRIIFPLLLVGFGATYVLLSWLNGRRWVTATRLKEAGLFSAITLCSILGVDLAYGILSNETIPTVEDLNSQRWQDEYVWQGEIYPRTYYPTDKNFQIQKPNVGFSATLYGQFYHTRLLKSPTLVNSVLEPRRQTFHIDQNGFRETTPLEEASVFALGDSYTMGENVTQDDAWVKVLERQTGQPTYNLGIRATGPKQQLMLLQYLLETQGDRLHVDHLVWMIFEGNDLQDSYQTYRPTNAKSPFKGTVVDALLSFPRTIRNSSVLYQWKTGELKSPVAYASPSSASSPYLVDGVRLGDPLYKSSRFGYQLFPEEYLERAAMPESYVLNHPNLPRLEQTFADMRALSQEHNFKVTVVIAPSFPRLYTQYFDGVPEISKQPYFINYVAALSQRMNFPVVNLYQLMAPYAEKEMLYARDDSHWNERGNQVAADLIAEHVFGH